VPPALNQLSRTVDKNQAAELFKFLLKYQPENSAAKQARLEAVAKAAVAGENAISTGIVPVLKFGLKHVTTLIEQKKAKLVMIAHDVDPVELVVWLPALCRKMDVPFCIVKGKGRLGLLTHQKTTAVCALTSIHSEDSGKLKSLQDNFRAQFNDVPERKWGGGIMGLKTQAKLAKRQAQVEKEESKKRELRSK
jgi:large subunit ribosomal protein L7Ae